MLYTRNLLFLIFTVAILIIIGTAWSVFIFAGIICGALLVALVVVDWFTTPLKMLSITRHMEPRLSIDAENIIRLDVHNRSNKKLILLIRDTPPASFVTPKRILSLAIEAGSRTSITYTVTPLRRGDYSFGEITVRGLGPLWLVRRQRTIQLSKVARVYPNLLAIKKYGLLTRRNLIQSYGLYRSRRLGTGTDFERLREYEPDDDYRRIDWNATARYHKPITRQYQLERSQNIFIMLDIGRSMGASIGSLLKLDYAINSALMLSYVGALHGDHVGMLTFTDQVETFISPKSGQRQFHKLLDTLYKVDFQMIEPDYRRACAVLEAKNRKRSLVVLFTDLQNHDTSKMLISGLYSLIPQHLPLCVLINDPQIIQISETIPHDSQMLYENMVAQKLRDERELLTATLAKKGIMTLDVPANQLTDSVINKYLDIKARGKL